eukprot:5453567-Pleurochrysis_carterae.AAC.1
MIGIGLAAWRRRSKMKRKADRVAVMMTARRPCMMAMPSEGCAGAMALSTVGSVPVLILLEIMTLYPSFFFFIPALLGLYQVLRTFIADSTLRALHATVTHVRT